MRPASPARGGMARGDPEVYSWPMELIGLALVGLATLVGVFAVGVTIEILFDRRFGVSSSVRRDLGSRPQAHHQAVRSQLGGFGPQG